MSVALRVRDLVVEYGRVRAVDDASIDVPAGALVAVLGPNGAGKSSLLRAVAGLAPRTAGTVELAGERIDAWPAHRIARAGLVAIPEGRGVFPALTVADNLRVTAPPGGRDAERDYRDRVLEAFPALAPRLAHQAATLSGGEQQMLALARAVAGAPRVLLIDEPSLGLAPRLVAEIYGAIERVKAAGRTVLLVEQFAAQALRVADLVYVMANGRVVFAGEPGELPHAPPLVERYLGAISAGAGPDRRDRAH